MKIVLSVAVALLFIGCSEDAQKEVAKTVAPIAEKIKEVAPQAAPKVEEAKDTISSMADSANAMAAQAKEVATTTVDKAQEMADSAVATTKDAVESTKVAATQAVNDVAQKVVAATATVSGADLYKTCAGCHGQNAEKKALGKSQVIQGWSVAKTTDALNGYKAGTYGGPMKGIMAGQVKKLSEDDIAAIAEYISSKAID